MNKVRMAVTGLTLSAAGLIGMAINEGYRGEAYIPTKGDVPTIGFGSTENVRLGDRTDPVSALQRMEREVRVKYESPLKQCVKVPLHQHEYDAYVDLIYNIGPGKEGVSDGFCWLRRGGNSTLVRRLNAGDYEGACNAILMWRKYKGFDCSTPGNKICYGLWKRRLETRAKCLGESP